MSTRRSLASLAAAIILTATTATVVAADSHTDPSAITGIDWSLTSITTRGTTTDVPALVGASLRLDEDATGSAGCNDFFGGYTLDGSELSFGPIAATKKLCQGIAQEIEDAYLPALGLVSSWSIAEGGGLSLLDSDGTEVLIYTSNEGGIEDVNWLLRAQVVDGAMADIPDGILATLHLEDGTASGTGGCNRYSAAYTLEGESLTFGPAATNLAACIGPGGDVEAAYHANLGSVASWESDGASLTSSDSEGNPVLTYEAQAEASIVGSWVASGINDGNQGVVSSASTAFVTAVFTEAGELDGSDGCNDYLGGYETDGQSIAIGPLRSTRRACVDDDVTLTATEYQQALGNASTWAITDTGNLELRDADGALQVSYVPTEG